MMVKSIARLVAILLTINSNAAQTDYIHQLSSSKILVSNRNLQLNNVQSSFTYLQTGFGARQYSFLNWESQAMFLNVHNNKKFNVTADFQLHEDFIYPNCPSHLASTIGISLKNAGWCGTIRYPYLDNGLESASTVVLSRNNLPIEFVAEYQTGMYSFGFTAENFLNAEWNTHQVKTESR